MKKSLLILSTAAIAASLSSCALVTVPVKIAGKAATTSIDVAGTLASGGVGLLTGNDEDEEEEE